MDLNTLWLDLKHVTRHLRRHPRFTLLSVAALAIGIGLVTAMYTIVEGTILRGPEFPGGDDLKVLRWHTPREGMFSETRIQDFDEIAKQQEVFEDLGFWTFYGANIQTGNITKTWAAARVRANFLDILQVQPVLGRGFQPGEDAPGAPPTVILGYQVWQEQFEANPEIFGERINVNGNLHIVIGVMPDGFRFPITQDVWVPYQDDYYKEKRGDSDLTWTYGYLRDGISRGKAKVQLDLIAARMAEAFPETNEHYLSVEIIPFIDEFMEDSKGILWTMLAAVALVLVIACANVANLILARSVARAQEMAVRSALGANRSRLVNQILTETLVITSCGGIGGVALALFGVRWFDRSFVGVEMPFWFDLSFSPTTILVILGLIVTTALVSGLYPAWSASRIDLGGMLSDATRSTTGTRAGRFNKTLTVFQISLSAAALIGSFGMIEANRKITDKSYPFDPEEILQAQFSLSEQQMPDDEEVIRFFRELDRALEAIPGVETVGQTTSNALLFPWTSRIVVEGKTYSGPDEYEVVQHEIVSWDYFQALGIPILEGRDFEEADGEIESWLGIINQAMADQFWPGESPIGKRIRDTWKSDIPWVQVIGVIPNLKMTAFTDDTPTPHYFRASVQAPMRYATIFLRPESGDPTALIPALEQTTRAINSEVVAQEPMTVAQRLDQNMRGLKVVTQIFGATGIVALLLGSIGIYGVISFATSQRTREFGIRLAIGATPRKIILNVLRGGSWQLAIGLILGGLIGFLLLRVLGSSLDGLPTTANAMVFVLPLATIFAVSLVAAWNPAFRASRISPTEAIRDL
jgi:putative ABC transport system permease protein